VTKPVGAESEGTERGRPKVCSMQRTTCFLCHPDPALVYDSSESFLALLGLGPLVEGYSLIASRAHIPSMFDLSDSQATELETFGATVQARLTKHWSPCVVTEHGRVGLCLESSGSHDEHCFHAHQLVFPGAPDFSSCLSDSTFRPIEAQSFTQARAVAGHLTEYLYYQRSDGSALVGHAAGHQGRQFFRRAIAEMVLHPEWQSWQAYPRLEVLELGRNKLFGTR